jgi:hypothetical protein
MLKSKLIEMVNAVNVDDLDESAEDAIAGLIEKGFVTEEIINGESHVEITDVGAAIAWLSATNTGGAPN